MMDRPGFIPYCEEKSQQIGGRKIGSQQQKKFILIHLSPASERKSAMSPPFRKRQERNERRENFRQNKGWRKEFFLSLPPSKLRFATALVRGRLKGRRQYRDHSFLIILHFRVIFKPCRQKIRQRKEAPKGASFGFAEAKVLILQPQAVIRIAGHRSAFFLFLRPTGNHLAVLISRLVNTNIVNAVFVVGFVFFLIICRAVRG